MSGQKTIYVIDDDSVARNSLLYLLEPDYSVHIFRDEPAFRRSYQPKHPECLLLDYRLETETGLDVLLRLAAQGLQIPVVMISGRVETEGAIEVMKQGVVVDFVLKPYKDEKILSAIEKALERDRVQAENADSQAAVLRRLDSLSAREREVLELVVDGFQNKRIAQSLEISQKTVEHHRGKMMLKMGVDSVADLVKLTFPYVANERREVSSTK